MTISVQAFRAAMARFPGAVTLIATGSGDARRGITATAVCSVTDDPPSLLACINRKSGTRDAIAGNGRFSVMLLDTEATGIARHFAGATGATGAAKFEIGDWGAFPCGLPWLQSAPVALACAVSEVFEVGSHSVFIGQIEESRIGEGAAVVYAGSGFHGLSRLPAA